MATVKIVFRKDKTNLKGETPIHFRIIKNRKISYISSGFMVLESEWDDVNKKIKGKISNSKETAARMNGMLYSKFSEIQNEVLYLETTEREISSKKIKSKIAGEEQISFFDFAYDVTDKYHAKGKIGTYSKTQSIIGKLKKYSPNATWSDIDPQFLNRYEKYMRKELQNSINTIGTNFRFIRTVFNKAFQQDVIEITQNPFLKFKIESEKTQRLYLSEEELTLLEELEIKDGLKMGMVRDMFIFSTYAGGLRVSDVLQLQWKHYDGERIDFTIKKTGAQLSIKLPNKAKEIIKRFEKFKKSNNSFIFDALPADLDLNDPVEVDRKISGATTVINASLKTIGKKAGIEKVISFHVSRHSWAVRALRKGISIDKVSKLMGHASIKQTQTYAQIVNIELDSAMDVFND